MNQPLVAGILLLAAAASGYAQDHKIICYFINWAWFRNEAGYFVPEHINPNLCTHIHYAFLNLDSKSLLPVPAVRHLDIGDSFYQRVLAMKKKNPDLKVSLALGGWGDSRGSKYSRMVSSSKSRKDFVKAVVDYLQEHNFDGLDVEWIHPKCWQEDCDKGREGDKDNFSAFLQDLYTAFKETEKRYLLSVTVTASPPVAAQAYDASVLSRVADYVQVMTYDYHGFWENKTGHVAPMYYREGDTNRTANVDSAMQFWVQSGIPREKLILGLPTFGRSFTLTDMSEHGLNAPTSFPGLQAQYMDMNAVGMVGYFEVCMRVKYQGWKKARDNKAGPYAFSGSQWVGYDDPVAVAQKATYVKENNFGGVRIWDLSTDDFRALCCNEKYPLLNIVNDVLSGKPPTKVQCEIDGEIVVNSV